MAWSKRSRIQLAAAIAVGLTALICIGVALGAWRATSNRKHHEATTSASDIILPTISPTTVQSTAPQETSSPKTSPPSSPPTLEPSVTPSQSPTQQPTSQPVLLVANAPTRLPSKSPTWYPTREPTQAPTASRLDSSDQMLTTFYAIADVPYNQVEANELPTQVRSIPSDAEFLLVRQRKHPFIAVLLKTIEP